MDKIKALLWLKYRTSINQFKTMSLLEKVAIIFFVLFSLMIFPAIYIATRFKIDFYLLSAIFAYVFLFKFTPSKQYRNFDQLADLKRYFYFPLSYHQLSISVLLQSIFSGTGLFYILSSVCFILCISGNLIKLVLSLFIIFLFVVFCFMMQKITFHFGKLPLFLFVRFFIFIISIFFYLSFMAVFVPMGLVKNMLVVFNASRFYSALMFMNQSGKTILRFFPTSAFSASIMDVMKGNYNSLTRDFSIAIFLFVGFYLILFLVVKKSLKVNDLVKTRSDKNSAVREKFIEFFESRLTIFKETKGIVHLQLKSLSSKSKNWKMIIVKYLIPLFLSLAIYITKIKFPERFIFLIYLFCLLLFSLTNPYIANYIAIENRAALTLLSFPINRKKFILQQNFIVLWDFILYNLVFSLFYAVILRWSLLTLIHFIFISITCSTIFISFGNFTSLFFAQKWNEEKKSFFKARRSSFLEAILLIVTVLVLLVLLYPAVYFFYTLTSKSSLEFKIISYACYFTYIFLLYLSTFNITLNKFINHEKKIMERLS